MPNIWYHESNYYKPPQEKAKYKVTQAEFIKSYHYHGSWFEYTWKLTLRDKNGNSWTRTLGTWRSYKGLNGKTIEYDGTKFEVIDERNSFK